MCFVTKRLRINFILGADVNKVDFKKRTAMHYYIAASKGISSSVYIGLQINLGDADMSFDVEKVLVDAGAKVNEVDYLGRTPLHYYFIKRGKANIHLQECTHLFTID